MDRWVTCVLVLSFGCRIGFDPIDPIAGDAATPQLSDQCGASDCIVSAPPGSDFDLTCQPGELCVVACEEAASCRVDCNGAARCTVTCSTASCSVVNCDGLCTVLCGEEPTPPINGTATCP